MEIFGAKGKPYQGKYDYYNTIEEKGNINMGIL